MSTEYPDVLGDLVDARRRFEVHGVHYVTALHPAIIAPGEATSLHVWLQNCWDVPVTVSVFVALPNEPPAGFSVIQQQTDAPLQAAEVGELTIPIASAAELAAGQYPIRVTVGVKAETRGLYVRSQENEGQLGDTLLSFTTGMALATSIGLGFKAHNQPERVLSLQVEGAPQPGPAPDLTPSFLCHWTVDDWPFEGRASKYVNDQRIYMLPKITRQSLYMGFLEESQARFKDASLPLEIGEAIFVAKILTHTVEYFLKRPDWQDVILTPPHVLAFRYNLPTSDPVFLIARADYARMARLACSLCFGLLRQRIGQDVWTLEEQLAVTDLVADRVERGGTLPAEFLYLPLLLGGLMVADEVQMPGENAAQSLGLLAKARKKRDAELAENPELVATLDRLLQMAGPGA